MWVNMRDEPLNTYGQNGKTFMLCLKYIDYYGHTFEKTTEVVDAIWDSTRECFFETETNKEICSCDIECWWKE